MANSIRHSNTLDPAQAALMKSYDRSNTNRSQRSHRDREYTQSLVSQPLTLQDEALEDIGLDSTKGGCIASVTTTFSAWNAMAGMGMVSMPWAFQ